MELKLLLYTPVSIVTYTNGKARLMGVGFLLFWSLSVHAFRYKEAGVSSERPLNKAIQVIIFIVFGIQSNALFILIYLEETKSEG